MFRLKNSYSYVFAGKRHLSEERNLRFSVLNSNNKYPLLWKKNITRIWDDAPIGGETIQEVVDRVFLGINRIKQSIGDKRILVVTHGFISKVFYYYFNPGIPKEDFFNYKLGNVEFDMFKY